MQRVSNHLVHTLATNIYSEINTFILKEIERLCFSHFTMQPTYEVWHTKETSEINHFFSHVKNFVFFAENEIVKENGIRWHFLIHTLRQFLKYRPYGYNFDN